ncbi:MAG: tetratricopeptide repeat protein [Clostridia bacterium]|nr:tetratricopeptide repeat protein [Clostridia bacterium]
MAKLECITNGTTSLKKKARVWFCAHPEDRDIFLKSVSAEILKIINCAVWYDEEPYAEYDENFFCDLAQMQLFVMPVTEKLLRGGNRALDVEFRYAMEHHIPVLPLMQEQGLEQLFNKKCGDLQFLDKNNGDVTAISYAEKLKKYLESVLISDETAKRVRAAFGAYIFLSYRKKDRKYAQELMRLIHKNEFCRDIAIWYDEFLTPGENFNENIAAALEKSELFVLAVTPNLVNEKNYVMTVEYPEAVRAGKKILPAELVATDRAELAEKYDGIAGVTDARDEVKLAAELSKVFGTMPVQKNSESPEHRYLIGLAYLGGIDVEKDSARALFLLESAAEKGCEAAMEKLSAMYANGEGVPRDLGKAVEWQKKLVETRRQLYEKSGEKALPASRYASAVYSLGMLLLPANRWEEALGAFSQALRLARGAVAKAETEALKEGTPAARMRCLLQTNLGRSTMIFACDGMIMIYRSRMMYEKLLEYSDIELDILNEWEKNSPKNNVLLLSRNKIYSTYAFNCNLLGRYEKAEQYYLLKIEMLKQSEGSGKDIADTYLSLAETMLKAENRERAKAYFRKALEFTEDGAGGTFSAQRRLGDIAFSFGENGEARDFYLRALELARLECEEKESVSARRNVYKCYEKLANISAAMGESEAQKRYFEEYGKCLTALAREAGEREVMYDLARYSEKLATDAVHEGKDLKNAEKHLIKSAEIMESFIHDEMYTANMQILCIVYGMIATVRKAAGDIVGAHAVYKKSIALCRRMEKEVQQGTARGLLLENYASMAGLCEEHGSLREALGYYEKAFALREEERSAEQSVKTARGMASAYADLARIHTKLKENYEAREYYAKEAEMRESIVLCTDDDEDKHLLALACANLAGFSGFFKKRRLARRALEIWRELAEKHPGEREYSRRLDALKKELKKK